MSSYSHKPRSAGTSSRASTTSTSTHEDPSLTLWGNASLAEFIASVTGTFPTGSSGDFLITLIGAESLFHALAGALSEERLIDYAVNTAGIMTEKLGVFLPRTWWEDDGVALVQAQQQTTEHPSVNDPGVRYQRAHHLHEWFEKFGHCYGWACMGEVDSETMEEAQVQADQGRVVLLAGVRSSPPGHISAIVPQSDEGGGIQAVNENGQYVPVQSQAGTVDYERATDTSWYTDTTLMDKKIWLHA